ncbi:hypothetical protein FRC10_012084 [Ceratobasidium sp. 414]|nr:hypothetical protein FRC10_012084 [Ceratobasidium sp. 414]
MASRTGVADTGDRLVERIAELERRLALARADEAQAKLELLTYRAKYPPPQGENQVAGTSSSAGKRPSSPSSGNKKAPKKKKKQADTILDDRVWFGERSAQLDAALEVIQKSFDPGAHLKSVGLVASLLRLRGAPALTVQPTVVPLLQRCLTDASAHVRHVCAHPTLQTSLDSLSAIQTLLPELLLAIQTRAPLPDVDDSGQELTRTLAHDLIAPVLRAIHPASIALASRASSSTRSRTRRGRLKAGARAAREAEEEIKDKAFVDVRPGLSSIVCLVAKAVKGGGALYAVLPLACQLVQELSAAYAPSKHRPSAPGSGAAAKSAQRIQRFAAADSLWYLSSACHAVFEYTAPFAPDDVELLSRCSDMLVAILTRTETRASEAVRDMLCALLERIMLSFPS